MHITVLAGHSRWFISSPLTLVSTWDGDELSLIRQHHQLRAARHLDVGAGSEALDEALSGVKSAGLGAYRVLDLGDTSAAVADALVDRGIALRRFPNGKLGVIPALDQVEQAARALGTALREAT